MKPITAFLLAALVMGLVSACQVSSGSGFATYPDHRPSKGRDD
ncbi:hypothetical protein OEZ71_04430 [Defluviimonas sp. WL0050]|uniref:Lipoprotein n=1 Tax=Albidovulum litorale TaxID=2984134 RepID=A0ABT2ZK75_9RHOB|nr:hypothetical protein [Defluviimonas sp. WL0050]MCV2871536.1 hypothetical protein [Defluviimonas sp. WL0050]